MDHPDTADLRQIIVPVQATARLAEVQARTPVAVVPVAVAIAAEEALVAVAVQVTEDKFKSV